MGKPERTILFIGGGVLALILVAALAAIVFGDSEVKEFPPGSPEAALQAYVRAVDDGDREAALALLSERVRRDVANDSYFPARWCVATDDRRIRFDSTSTSDDRATIHLTIEQRDGGLFDTGGNSYPRDVLMVREQGEWKIDEQYPCF